MIIDCRDTEWQAGLPENRHRVFVDGIEIVQVFFVDTEAGLVRTYDVFGDGLAHCTRAKFPPDVILDAREQDFANGMREPWDMPPDGVMSKTIRGTVELKPWEG